MAHTQGIRPMAVKAVRIAMVFMLVFWSSLRVEYLTAFGADASTVIPDDGATHAEQALTDLVIYQSSADKSSWVPVPGALSSGGQEVTVDLSVADGEQQFVAVPIWDGQMPSGYSQGAGVSQLSSATFAKWNVDNPDAAAATKVVDGKNILTLTPSAAGSVVVRVGLDGSRPESLKALAFTVKVAASSEPGSEPGTDPEPEPVETLELSEPYSILDADGKAISDETGLVLDKNYVNKPYKFNATVGIRSSKGTEATYSSLTDGQLSQFTANGLLPEGQLNDLAWSVATIDAVSGGDAATITETGELTVTSEGRYEVTCVASAGNQQMPYKVGVTVGDPDQSEDPQGRSRPQNSLLVSSNFAFPIASSVVPDPGDAPAPGDEPAPDDEPVYEGGPEDADEVVIEEGEETATLNQPYSLDQLNSYGADGTLSFSTKTYNMRTADSVVTITGNGFALKDIVADAFAQAGADMSTVPIEKVQFINYSGAASAEIPWSTVQKTDIMVAAKSYVHVEGDGDKEEGELELLDNTRFRILFDSASSSVNADSLRWIKEIRLIGETQSTAQFKTSIAYTPVPYDVYAELVAVPGMGISGSWDCSWEVLPADGIEWLSVLSDGSAGLPLADEDPDNLCRTQSLRVKTTEQTVGNQYRVTITTSKGEIDRSDPVELVASDDPCIQLSYNPPKAGDLAIFQSSVYGYGGDVSGLEYVWEWSDDGGSTWSTVPNETSPTLKVQTEESTSSGDDAESPEESGPADLIYIRVRAITPDDFVMISNVVPLTVHVGDEDSGTSGDENGRVDGEDQPTGGETESSTPGSPTSTPSSGGSSHSTPSNVTELDGITVEPPMPTASLNPDGTTTVPNPQTSFDASRVYINDAVTEQIAEQQEAAEEYAASNVPGARWTQLNTLNPDGDDVRRVLEGNPLAPFVVPFGLGVTVAGGVEKLLIFRRQLG